MTNKRFSRIVFLVLMFFLISLFINQNVLAEDNIKIVKAKIIDVETHYEQEINKQKLTLIIEQGKFKGEKCSINRNIIKYTKYDFLLRKDSYLYIYTDEKLEKPENVSIAYISREDSLFKLFIAFFVVLIVLGSFKGLRSAISLIITFFVIIKGFIPYVVNGANPITTSVICSIIIIIISFVLINGFGKKTTVAIIGTITGTTIAGILAAYFCVNAYITGLTNENMQFIVTELGINIDLKGLLFSGIIFGALGAVMDVSMSISSFINELQDQRKRLSFVQMFLSGYRVGKDMMATMVNTLILAYVGTALPMFLLMGYIDMKTNNIINSEIIATEIIRSLCGSIGLMLTIPFTAFIGALIFSKK